MAISGFSRGLDSPLNVQRVVNPTLDPYDPYYVVEPGGSFDGVVNVTNSQYQGSGVLLETGVHILTAAHVVDLLDPFTQVHFDLGSGRSSYSVSEIHLHPQWNSGWGYDLAILELEHMAPVPGYPVYNGPTELEQPFTLVGYGVTGTGFDGHFINDSQVGLIKRWGLNQYDALDSDFISYSFGDAPESSLLFYDFDDGSYQNDTLGRLLGRYDIGFGKEEVISSPGDSGGPIFLEVDGQYQVAGIVRGGSDLGGAGISGVIDSSFGEVADDTRVAFFHDWISTVAGLPVNSNPIESEHRLLVTQILEQNEIILSIENKEHLIEQVGLLIGQGHDSSLAISAKIMHSVPQLRETYSNLTSLTLEIHALREVQASIELFQFNTNINQALSDVPSIDLYKATTDAGDSELSPTSTSLPLFDSILRGGDDGVDGANVIDTLVSIEHKEFLNARTDLVFEDPESAGAIRQACCTGLRRLPDFDALGGVDFFDSGTGRVAMSRQFIQSNKFQQNYGNAVTDDAFGLLLDNNILGSDPEQGDLGYWLNKLAIGRSHAEAEILPSFSESQETQLDVVGCIVNGFEC